ncbi:protein of unknown function (DUF4061) [Carpediemonas membranifera]|uniref:Uncharacterized protein n=1 Tax=Carpediemonas membranifera TaxID=201153 RepID=A0A8J6E5P0_9EUKA|nr:protein of unknown function (DUF4061) [Carpediemonas membranifera]|eukprot:KAG9396052.1 protein of unknown function (DUF4061) [Carpediemonas membranifera]
MSDFETVEQALMNLQTKFNSGECRAFGMNTRKIMKEMNRLRETQTALAIDQIRFNVSFPDINEELASHDEARPFVITDEHLDRLAQVDFHEQELHDLSTSVQNIADIVSQLGKLRQEG